MKVVNSAAARAILPMTRKKPVKLAKRAGSTPIREENRYKTIHHEAGKGAQARSSGAARETFATIPTRREMPDVKAASALREVANKTYASAALHS
jgi:hypothetical protein